MFRNYFIIFFLFSSGLFADFLYETQWETFDTTYFTLIYDKQIREDAFRTADALDYYYPWLAGSLALNTEIDHYTVLLSSQGVMINGWVNPLPSHSRFFSLPPERGSTLEWYTHLAIHETRHMAQLSKFGSSPFQKTTQILMGDLGAFISGLFPMWYLEGDAVLIETLLGPSGRGHLPDFEKEIRSLLLTGKDFSMEHLFYQSYNERYPNYYVLGYFLVTYLNRTYGPEMLTAAVEESWNTPIPMTFPRSIKKLTGKSLELHFEDMKRELKELWLQQEEGLVFTPLIPIPTGSVNSCDYTYLSPRDSQGYLALKKGMGTASSIVFLNQKGEEQIIAASSGSFSAAKGRLVTTAIATDLRRSEHQNQNLIILDGEGKKVIDHDTIYRFPSLSPDGTMITAVDFPDNRKASLVVLNSENGEILERIICPFSSDLYSPSFDDEGRNIVFIYKKDHRKGIARYSLEEKSFFTEVEEGYEDISNPVLYKGELYFNSSWSGIDNIYKKNSEGIFMVTSHRFGSGPFTVKEGKIYLSDYTPEGYKPCVIPLSDLTPVPLNEVPRKHVDYFEPLSLDENRPDPHSIPSKEYEVKEYYPSLNMVNVHSWIVNPVYPQEELLQGNLTGDKLFSGIEVNLLSQDLLTNLTLNSFYRYQWGDKGMEWGTDLIFSRFFPRFELTGSVYLQGEEEMIWKDLSLQGGVVLPLNFSSTGYLRTLDLSTFCRFMIPDSSSDFNEFSMNYALSFYNGKKSAPAKEYPDFRQRLSLMLNHNTAPAVSLQMTASGEFAFPGFRDMDSLLLDLAWGRSLKGSEAPALLWSGDSEHTPVNLWYGNISYNFLLGYPDTGIGTALYFKRLSSKVDISLLAAQNASLKYYPSLGAGIVSRFYLLDIALPLDLEISCRYSFSEGVFSFQDSGLSVTMPL